MRKHAKCGFVFLVVVFLLTGCAKHNGIDSMDEFIKQNIILDKSTELESYEWINEEILRVRVKYQEQLENAYLHKEDYFFFFEDEELVQTLYVDYPTKDYENIDKDRYVGDACNFEAHMEDVTFDGNEDLIISLGHFGVHGTEGSCAYIYTTEGYRYEPTFEDIPAYEIDEENQVIKGCNVDSASGKSEYIFVYENNQFVQKEHTTYLYDETVLDWEELILTAEEEKILCDIYVEDERIRAGELYDFQIVLVNQMRFAKEYLCDKYTDIEFEIVTCSPANDEKDIVEMTFQDNSGDGTIFNLELTQKEGRYSAVDDYYGKLLQVEYDSAVSDVLKNEGFAECTVYTVFNELYGSDMNGKLSSEDIIALGNLPERTTSIYIDKDDSNNDELITELKIILRDNRLFGVYNVYMEPKEDNVINFNLFDYMSDSWKIEKVTEYDADGNEISATSYTYTEDGVCISDDYITDIYNATNLFDDRGRWIEGTYVTKLSDGDSGTKIQYWYEETNENAWKSVAYRMNGEDGEWDIVNTTYYYYDDNNLITSEKTYRNDSQDIKDLEGEVEYLYDDNGHLIEKNTYQCFEGEKGLAYGHEIYTYDERGNKIEEYISWQDGSLPQYHTYEYDEYGNCIRKNVYDSRDEIARYTIEVYEDLYGTGEFSRVSSFEYNSNGQVSFGFEDTYEQGILTRRDYYDEKGMSKYILYGDKQFPQEEKGARHTTTDIAYDMNGKQIGKTVTEYKYYE